MAFQYPDSGAAAIVFLALYTVFIGFMIYVVSRKGFKTVYLFLLLFPVIRFGGQLCGMMYAILGAQHWQWLIAYLVLGAEGYFALILAAFNFVCRAQKEMYGTSWLKEKRLPLRIPIFRTWAATFHWLLIPANVLLIVGGSLMASLNADDWASEQNKVMYYQRLRTAGQAVFLFMTIISLACALHAYFNEHIHLYKVKAVMVASVFLIIRGIFGVLSIWVNSLDYFAASNYTTGGMSSKLLACEYCLSTTPEFIAAVVMLSSIFAERREAGLMFQANDPESAGSLDKGTA